MTKKKPKYHHPLYYFLTGEDMPPPDGTPKMPEFICSSCGLKYGDYSVGCSSYTPTICEICGVHDMCTEPRDFGYIPRWKGERWDDE